MTNLIVLDGVIYFVFIFLLYSRLTTILQELPAIWFSFLPILPECAIFRMPENGTLYDKRFKNLLALFKNRFSTSTDTAPVIRLTDIIPSVCLQHGEYTNVRFQLKPVFN
jgi:hypothetical protein